MSRARRRRAVRHCALLPWLTACGAENERVFIQVGASLLTSEAFLRLTWSQRMLFLDMCCAARGRREFEFPAAEAKRYGMNLKSFRCGVEALQAAGFIETVQSGRLTRENNIYRFCIPAGVPAAPKTPPERRGEAVSAGSFPQDYQQGFPQSFQQTVHAAGFEFPETV